MKGKDRKEMYQLKWRTEKPIIIDYFVIMYYFRNYGKLKSKQSIN